MVASSANSRSLPTGIPMALRVAFMPQRLEQARAGATDTPPLVSPSTVGFVARLPRRCSSRVNQPNTRLVIQCRKRLTSLNRTCPPWTCAPTCGRYLSMPARPWPTPIRKPDWRADNAALAF